MIICPFCQVQDKLQNFYKSQDFIRITTDNSRIYKEYVCSVACPNCYKVFIDIKSLEKIEIYNCNNVQ